MNFTAFVKRRKLLAIRLTDLSSRKANKLFWGKEFEDWMPSSYFESSSPSSRHQGAVNRALTYLNGTKTFAIEYKSRSENVILGASDASFADDSKPCRSTEGYLFQLFDGSVVWRSTKQRTVTAFSIDL